MNGQTENVATPTSIEELEPKMKLHGKVTGIQLAGALVDVGVGTVGRLHISQISKEPVYNASDALSVGDEVTVWVRRVNTETNQVDLTRVEPTAVDWDEIARGQVRTGRVTRIEKFGAFIDLGAERPGLVHVSELSSGYVGAAEEVVKVGDEVQVKVINVDRRKRQIDLSIKALEMEEFEEDESEFEEEELPTAMAFALKRAMEGNDTNTPTRSRRRSRKDSRKRKEEELEDIISRTLQQHHRND